MQPVSFYIRDLTHARLGFSSRWVMPEMMLELTDVFIENLCDSSVLEATAVIFGLLSVWFARQANIWVYPTGIVSVLIYVYICFVAKLYADMGINAFYFVMSVYGWYNWTRVDVNKKFTPVTYCSKKEHGLSLLAGLLFFLLIRYVLIYHTDSNVPNWDALTTAIFIVAMWLMARKKVEHWAWWIVGNVISIPLYASKALVLTSFQYLVFLVLAMMGYVTWVKIVRSGTEKA